MRIIPAIDIIDGKCVRLSKGDYSTKKIYHEDPLEVARAFEENGIQYLHLVDLDGAKAKNIVNHKVLEKITSNTSLKVDFGGGIKSKNDVRLAFASGASQITLGSIAVNNPEFCLSVLEEYGPEKVILGADCMNRKIRTSGWLENSGLDVVDFIAEYRKKGILNVICTDISKDGMLVGPSTELYQEILASAEVNLIASGGISDINDVKKMKEIGCFGTIIGKAIYENRISLDELLMING
ncbi:1-(5-phosphoribosyl)-5-[(5-phosphoribosylamino)methylideneamino]imidazole-4-carboxamide isomerase [Weeksellaceae bacterium A-14]